jgi:hypothetical protein
MDVLVRGPEREDGVERTQITAPVQPPSLALRPPVSSLRVLRVNFLIDVLSNPARTFVRRTCYAVQRPKTC